VTVREPLRVLPIELQIGDRLTDEMGVWEVIDRPYTTARSSTPGFSVLASSTHGVIRVGRARARHGGTRL